jgi:hypothetical protein
MIVSDSSNHINNFNPINSKSQFEFKKLPVMGESDNLDQADSYIPLVVAKKDSNFSDNEFSLYLNKSQIFEIEDLASTICALLNIEVPRNNQGKFIDEILQLLDYISEDEKKLVYLDLRQQQQKLIKKLTESK